ncbi:transposase [Streptomyces sp. NPDC088354]|uniref:transposase n=1 Tax=Streptomyces sp. NPDC088354 TaxID=3365856 RepID=UPI00382889B8
MVTDKVMDGMAEGRSRPLGPVHPMLFIDCVHGHVKVGDGRVANRPFCVALAVTSTGPATSSACGPATAVKAPITGSRSSPKSRGGEEVCMVVCDGLKGLPDTIGTAATDCHPDLRCPPDPGFVPLRGPTGLGPDVPRAQAHPHGPDRESRRGPLPGPGQWGAEYPAIIRLWESSRPELVSFLHFDTEIRRVVSTTNAIESLNAHIRKAVRARGHFPNKAATLKCFYLAS